MERDAMKEDVFKMDIRKQPYQEKFIHDLAKEDFKVAVSGFIVSKSTMSFVLDDGTGELFITCQEVPKEDFVKVFGIVVPAEKGFELQADIIQDYGKADKNLLKKVKELLR